VRCRRKDITQLFLGTGLGSRSYAIIEQNMISRVIEARPEDMRGFLEEAAGISRYKERRRETETRIGHTRENLERLGDVERKSRSSSGTCSARRRPRGVTSRSSRRSVSCRRSFWCCSLREVETEARRAGSGHA
jgi:hypothetical protein